MFDRKQTTNETIPERAQPFLEYRRRLGELDLRYNENITLALYCLSINPGLIKDLDLNDEFDAAAIEEWFMGCRKYRDSYGDEHVLGGPSSYFSCLRSGAESTELLALYLKSKLKSTIEPVGKELSLFDSFDKKIVLNYQYETKRGETVSYFDQTLGIPTILTARARVKIKLIDVQKFVEKVDVSLREIDAKLVRDYLTVILNRVVRDTILSFIAEKNLSFYELPQAYTLLNQNITASLQKPLADAGLVLLNFSLSDIALPDDTNEMLKDQLFAIAETERTKALEQRMATQAMDLYERKADIHEKHPNYPVTLTEAEKDFALRRYLNRIGKDTRLRANINKKALKDRVMANQGTLTENGELLTPDGYKNKRNKFRIFFGVMATLLFLVAFGVFSSSLSSGLIALGVAVLATGLTGILGYDKLKEESEPLPLYNLGGDEEDETEPKPILDELEVEVDEMNESNGDATHE